MSKVQMQGLLATGYGIVPKIVMRDVELSIEAKAIYAYLTTFADGTGQAFPSVDLVCHDLDISRQRFNRHRKMLEDKGYITVHRERAETGFTKNVYTINTTLPKQNVTLQNPTESGNDEAVPSQNQTLQNVTSTEENETVPLQNVTSQDVTQSGLSLQNLTTNNTSLNNTSINNTNIKHNNVDVVNAFSFYEQNGFGILTPHIGQMIDQWIQDLNENLVLHAMKIAIENNVLKWNYVNKILIDWSNKKYKTVADVEAAELQRRAQQSKRKPYYNKPQREEQVPSWFSSEPEPVEESASNETSEDVEALRRQLMEDLGSDPNAQSTTDR